jgi:hypothetical protein
LIITQGKERSHLAQARKHDIDVYEIFWSLCVGWKGFAALHLGMPTNEALRHETTMLSAKNNQARFLATYR